MSKHCCYAILIGNSIFPEESKLTELRCPEHDVEAVDAVLRDPAFGGFTQTFSFPNRPSHEILPELNRILSAARKDDLVLVYYSGHGKRNSSGHLCLTTHNTTFSALEATSIPTSFLKYLFDQSNSRRKVLLLDCCYSGLIGTAFVPKGDVDSQLQDMSGEGTFIMTASTGIEVAVEKEGDRLGLFTKHLVEGIRSGEADTNEDGWVDMQELYEYVHEQVRAEGIQEPMQWGLDAKGRILIARSGKIPREKQLREAKRRLFELAAEERLTESIVFEAVNVLAIPRQEMTARDQECSLLVRQLVSAKISPPVFIEQWVRACITRRSTESKEERSVRPIEPEPKASVISPPAQASRPTPQQGDIIRDEFIGMEFVSVPRGCFQMGSPENEKDRYKNEGPVHKVCVDGFWMGKYEVTQGQWQKIMGKNPARFKKGDKYPVECVSWKDVQKFISKLNKKSGNKYRLPTEAEWEYAARARSSKYSGGDDLDAVAWYRDNSGNTTHPVGEKKANDFGLYDMSGNVWEWCADWYGEKYYASSPKNNPTGPDSGVLRVLRGGSWVNNPVSCRSVYRYRRASKNPYRDIGFRLILPFQAAGS